MKKRIISLILCVAMCVSIISVLSGCKKKNKTDAFVIMTENLDGLFNPFFSTSGADSTIVSMTQIGMLTYGYKNGSVVVAYGDDQAVVTKDYKSEYNSGSDTTTYTFVIKNGLKFSDGQALTMEDVLFNLYVYLDPVYTGSSTMYSTDIVGLADYRTQTSGADDTSDDALNESARDMAQNRLNELVNLFLEVKDAATSNEAGYNAMISAIASHSLSDGYISAISNDASKVSTDNLKEDYLLALEYFREELETDYESAKEAYTEAPYKNFSEFQNDVTCFLYYEGFTDAVDVKFVKDENGKDIKSQIESVNIRYASHIDTKEEAIEYVYNSKITSELDIIIQYWATAQKLQTEFAAKAKEVLLHQNADGSLSIPNISGIVSLGHTTDVDSVTIGNNTYTVAHEHNADGTPKNAGEYDVLEITINGIDPKAVWNFSFAVAPQHYYAEGYTVDIARNNFGVDFGSFDYMTGVIQSQRNVTVPMGAGAYKATNSSNGDNPSGTEFFNSNVVYFKANDNFMFDVNIEKIRYQVVSSSNALDALEAGTVHYVSPQLTTENEERLDGLKKSGIESISVDQLGYGYVGINAGKVPNIYLRRAIMAAMDTSLAIQYYSPGTANRIYWPMSTVSWAYPKDEDGNNLPYNYGDYPAVQWSWNSAKSAIEEYMLQADGHMGGYDSSDLEITFTIAGSNLTDHPTYAVFQTAAQLLNECGWDVEVIADTQALTKLSTGSLAVWAAAWGTTVDPDMYQVYHKDSTATSVYAWGYREILNNTTKYNIEYDILCDLSDLIDEARETDVQSERSELYEEAMSYVLELAVELPVYQRKVLYAYNTDVIDESSLPSNINPYSSPLDRIWEIKFAE